MGNSRFFCNRDCEYFPCHEGIEGDRFNCLFCYCPLYAMGSGCGGNCSFIKVGDGANEKEVKDCSACLIPHQPENYDYIIKKLMS